MRTKQQQHQSKQNRRAVFKARGLCACGQPRSGDLESCDACMISAQEADTRWRNRKLFPLWLDCCQSFKFHRSSCHVHAQACTA